MSKVKCHVNIAWSKQSKVFEDFWSEFQRYSEYSEHHQKRQGSQNTRRKFFSRTFEKKQENQPGQGRTLENNFFCILFSTPELFLSSAKKKTWFMTSLHNACSKITSIIILE